MLLNNFASLTDPAGAGRTFATSAPRASYEDTIKNILISTAASHDGYVWIQADPVNRQGHQGPRAGLHWQDGEDHSVKLRGCAGRCRKVLKWDLGNVPRPAGYRLWHAHDRRYQPEGGS
jgi:hypothetical protein